MKSIKNNTKHGFTLVELMVGLVIISILVSIALPNYARTVEKAKGAQAVQVLKEIRGAAITYFNEIDHATMTQNTFTGMDLAQLELLVGANFFSSDVAANADTNQNKDWHYTIATNTATRLVLQARRRGGHWALAGRTNITLTDDITNNTQEAWSNPAVDYPWDNPGGW